MTATRQAADVCQCTSTRAESAVDPSTDGAATLREIDGHRQPVCLCRSLRAGFGRYERRLGDHLLPVLVLFLATQRRFIARLAKGGTQGLNQRGALCRYSRAERALRLAGAR